MVSSIYTKNDNDTDYDKYKDLINNLEEDNENINEYESNKYYNEDKPGKSLDNSSKIVDNNTDAENITSSNYEFSKSNYQFDKKPSFYDKKQLEQKNKERKLAILRERKLKEEEKSLKKREINKNSKKIIEQKLNDVRPIYERANELVEIKKIRLIEMKKTINESKLDETTNCSKISSASHYDKEKFNEWRNKQIDWEKKTQGKIRYN